MVELRGSTEPLTVGALVRVRQSLAPKPLPAAEAVVNTGVADESGVRVRLDIEGEPETVAAFAISLALYEELEAGEAGETDVNFVGMDQDRRAMTAFVGPTVLRQIEGDAEGLLHIEYLDDVQATAA